MNIPVFQNKRTKKFIRKMSFTKKLTTNAGYSSELEEDRIKANLINAESQRKLEDLMKKPSDRKVEPYKPRTDLHARISKRFPGNGYLNLNAFDRHKQLISAYQSFVAPAALPKPKTDADVIKENYRFLGDFEDSENNNGGRYSSKDEEEEEKAWEKKLAKSYYDKLFKEYCVADMSRYKEGKIGMRWRTQKELFDGKGQFICGSKECARTENLESYEVNFSYSEANEHKNALVKLRVCPEHAAQLNFKSNKRKAKEIRKLEKKERKRQKREGKSEQDNYDVENENELEEKEEEEQQQTQPQSQQTTQTSQKQTSQTPHSDSSSWQKKPEPEKTKEDEFQDFFEGMFL